VSNNRKSRDDYNETIRCADCGSETGPFVTDTDDDDIICQDCLMALPSEEELLFAQALESSRNWEQASNRNGLILLQCAHCCEVVHTFGENEWVDATTVLEADEEHECEEEEG
jgi:hypothetical protein